MVSRSMWPERAAEHDRSAVTPGDWAVIGKRGRIGSSIRRSCEPRGTDGGGRRRRLRRESVNAEVGRVKKATGCGANDYRLADHRSRRAGRPGPSSYP